MSSVNTSYLQQYSPAVGAYDELELQESAMPAHWQKFFSAYNLLSEEELRQRKLDMQRLLKENGVTYTIYNDNNSNRKSWEIDPIPYIITEEEWIQLEKGLQQRCQLLDKILQDIYGQQDLVTNGVVPADLIYQHPGFIRQMSGVAICKNVYLPFYAADLARSANGKLWVIGDRTQAPSGSGYALENRMAMSSIMPELFEGVPIRRLGLYFNDVYQTLASLSPKGIENPRIVVLTPGTGNETYFEHAYLAAFLGISLVEGNDLMVKEDHVWLKTMEGLEKVDVILRRLDDSYCDPLELKPESLLGIPGLLHVVRKGNVSIANPIGSSIVENPGLLPFLQNIADYFGMGPLLLPSIATWWCGQAKELDYVLDHIDELIIKKIFRAGGGQPSLYDGSTLLPKEKNTLIKAIKKNPQWYVGQEKIVFSCTPLASEDGITAGHVIFRSFITNDGTKISVMPGGLARTGTDEQGVIISNQSGGKSKDTWVLGENHTTEIAKQQPFHINTFNNNTLPSHTAETLFWTGRYTERVLSNARVQRTVMQYIFQGNKQIGQQAPTVQKILLQMLTEFTFTYPGFVDGEEAAEKLIHPATELCDIMLNEKRSGSLASNIQLFRNAFYNTREYWNSDIWKLLHQMEIHWEKTSQLKPYEQVALQEGLESVISSVYAILGLNRESIRRDKGWIMLDIGRKLEQALNSINLLKSVFTTQEAESIEHDLIQVVLYSNQSLTTYRYTYRDHLRLPLMLDLLILDPENPKALSYMLSKLKLSMQQLPRPNNTAERLDAQERIVLEADTLVKLADKEKLSKVNPENGHYEELQNFLDELFNLLYPLADLLSSTYFKHTQTRQQLNVSTPII